MRSELKSILNDQEVLKNRLIDLVKKQIKEISMLRFGEKDAESVVIGDDWCAYLDDNEDRVHSLSDKGVLFTYPDDCSCVFLYEDISYTQIKNLVFDLERYIDNLNLHVSKKNNK